MRLTLNYPNARPILARPLSRDAFADFGTVIENPAPQVQPSPLLQVLPETAVAANQGTALKYVDVSKMTDLYRYALSGVESKAVMNLFACGPRALERPATDGLLGTLPLKVLERHPFTTQTFIPLGLSGAERNTSSYVVIVAPSLPLTPKDPSSPSLPAPPSGQGLPDLARLQAFIATGSQAVTYGAGTWHAPMVVIGSQMVNFVVVQFANGVPLEDCQVVDIQSRGADGLQINIPPWKDRRGQKLAKL
jgi:ureidoglycolate lyase